MQQAKTTKSETAFPITWGIITCQRMFLQWVIKCRTKTWMITTHSDAWFLIIIRSIFHIFLHSSVLVLVVLPYRPALKTTVCSKSRTFIDRSYHTLLRSRVVGLKFMLSFSRYLNLSGLTLVRLMSIHLRITLDNKFSGKLCSDNPRTLSGETVFYRDIQTLRKE